MKLAMAQRKIPQGAKQKNPEMLSLSWASGSDLPVALRLTMFHHMFFKYAKLTNPAAKPTTHHSQRT